MFQEIDRLLQKESRVVMVWVLAICPLVLAIGCAPTKELPPNDNQMFRTHVDNGCKPGYWVYARISGNRMISGAVQLTEPDSLVPRGPRYPIIIERHHGSQMEGRVDIPASGPPSMTSIRIVFGTPVVNIGDLPAVLYWSADDGNGIEVRFARDRVR